MTEPSVYFDDAAAYEAVMGRWSRSAGAVFLDWIAPPKHVRWLDIGCGTGVFTELIVNTASPAVLSAIDPSSVQIEHARRQPIGQKVDFQIGDAQALPFSDNDFDVVVSALVLNFIADQPKALAEMRRVGRAGGMVAAYVWDFAGERSPGSILRTGLQAIGIDAPKIPGTTQSTIDALQLLFGSAGLENVDSRTIDVTSSFASFDDLWRAQTPSFSPATKIVAGLTEGDRARLIEKVSASLPTGRDGSVAYSARAHAIAARIPA